jgi:phosphomannomutase
MSFYTIFVFDVDGTLTPSRDIIDSDFESYFVTWAISRNVHLITGSDYAKTLEQVGKDVMISVSAVHNCAGNSIWSRGEEKSRNEWTISKDAKAWLNRKLEESNFTLRTGTHIEERCGLVNFSTIGRGASKIERQIYVKFDKHYKEREQIAKEFNAQFPELEAAIGGETGIDIYQKGRNKAQILSYLGEVEELIFFGDAMEKGGNDWPLAEAIRNRNNSKDRIYQVDSWRETYDIMIRRYHEELWRTV